MSPDEIAAELLERVGHVHVATTPDGWHCFTVTLRGSVDDVEVLCGDGRTMAEALEAVLAQSVAMEAPPGAVRGEPGTPSPPPGGGSS